MWNITYFTVIIAYIIIDSTEIYETFKKNVPFLTNSFPQPK